MTRKTAEKASVREGAVATAAAGLVDDRSKRPGFKIPRKTARLQFEGDEFEGCEIIMALDLTLKATQHMEALQKAAMPNTEEGAGALPPEELQEKFRVLLTFFTEECIVSWNLEDAEGVALPRSADTFLQFPGWFAVLVMNGYAEAVKKVSEVSGPLGGTSKNGSTSEEQSVMTEAQSSALPS